MYQTGDYVYPADMPRRLLCRVAEAESWGTLIRLDETVRPARVRAALVPEADSPRSTANGTSPRIEGAGE